MDKRLCIIISCYLIIIKIMYNIISAKRGMYNKIEIYNIEVSYVIGKHPFDVKMCLLS